MSKTKRNTSAPRAREKGPRELAALSLEKWEKQGKYAGLETVATLSRESLSDADRGLYTALVYGVVERAVTLDHIISLYCTRPADSLEVSVRNALRLGLYQLIYMDRIPEHAAVSETVALAPRRAAGLVNATLRSFIRDGRVLSLPPEEDTVEHLSVKYSVPPRLCRFFLDAYGREDAEGILASSFGGDRLSLRVNTTKITTEEACRRLAELGAQTRISTFAENVILLSSGAQFLEGIEKGLWYVQDEASAAAVQVLSPACGSTVIDLCAAPGGKSFGCAIAMENRGRVLSFDIHKNKLSLINSGAERMGFSIIECAVGDGKAPAEELFGIGDCVICDAPCSGLGVMAKKPDIRYKEVADIEGLPQVQYDILCGAAACVRVGGALLYSTCTLNPLENEAVFRRFAESHPDFVPEPFDLHGMGSEGYATLLPHKTGTDGFFISKFRRIT